MERRHEEEGEAEFHGTWERCQRSGRSPCLQNGLPVHGHRRQPGRQQDTLVERGSTVTARDSLRQHHQPCRLLRSVDESGKVSIRDFQRSACCEFSKISVLDSGSRAANFVNFKFWIFSVVRATNFRHFQSGSFSIARGANFQKNQSGSFSTAQHLDESVSRDKK